MLLTLQGANIEEVKHLPCELLEQIELLWRQYTNNHCGFYGDNFFYRFINCKSLQGRTLTEQALFSNYKLIGGSEADTQAVRLKKCNIAPVYASVYQ